MRKQTDLGVLHTVSRAMGAETDGERILPDVAPRYDVSGNIIAFENNELDHDDTVTLFQFLIDTGLAWQLQGYYGRCAVSLIQSGDCHR